VPDCKILKQGCCFFVVVLTKKSLFDVIGEVEDMEQATIKTFWLPAAKCF
jgi:hypothetical protein